MQDPFEGDELLALLSLYAGGLRHTDAFSPTLSILIAFTINIFCPDKNYCIKRKITPHFTQQNSVRLLYSLYKFNICNKT